MQANGQVLILSRESSFELVLKALIFFRRVRQSVINKTLNSQSKLFVALKKGKHFGCHNKSSQSIFFGPTFKLCQRRLILSPFPLKTRRPTPPARPAHLSHPSFQAKNSDLFFTSAQHFSENVKFMFYCLSL